MGLLETLRERLSGSKIRSSNFEKCVNETAGCKVIHRTEKSDRIWYEIHVADNVRLESDFIRMLNTPHVRLEAVQTEDRATYLEVVVN